jgi:putative NADH-flavin reductase
MLRAMKLIVFGGTGGTGLALIAQALDAGHAVTAFVRSPDRLGALRERVRVVIGDVFDAAAVTEAIRGHDAVLSALGTRPWRHVDLCSGGTRVIAGAMRAAGVRRIIALSTQGVGDSKLGALGRVLAALALRRAFRDKQLMEEELAAGDLDWIVVRPGLLTNGKPRGRWRAADDGSLRGGSIARADVAAFMLQQLASDEWLRRRAVLVR